jgi:hypothetical protein
VEFGRYVNKWYKFGCFFNIKTYIMKKFLALLTITGFLIACNDSAETDSTAGGDTTATSTTPTPDTTTATTPAPLKDSLMQFKDGKVMIVVGGSWAALSAAVTTTNGRTVNPDGEVTKGKIKRKMEEGMMIDKDGQMMDKDGKIMDNTGWE